MYHVFDGSRDSDVNVLLNSIESFEDCTTVSDDNARKEQQIPLDVSAANYIQKHQ